jgi:large subunit ribosomal protein L24
MAKAKIRKDDVVYVIAGADKGKSGKVLKVIPKKDRVIVEGVAVRKKAVRRSQKNPEGGIINVEAPIHISNVMESERYRARREKKQQEA